MDRMFRLARVWSNEALRNLGPHFGGDILHVSAWRDEDKQGGYYREYFPNAQSYAISNFAGDRGYQGGSDELFLDLTARLPDELRLQFDVVFNHTTLEHIYDAPTAFANICGLSRDSVIVVVPFAQVQHHGETYADYWRFTPPALARMYEDNGFSITYMNANKHKNSAIYVLAVGSRTPDKWKEKLPNSPDLYPLGRWIGYRHIERVKQGLLSRLPG